MDLLLLDTETTGLGVEDRLIQIAFKPLKKGGLFGDLENNFPPTCALFCPPVQISFEAMATHHITSAMVADQPVFQNSEEKKYLDTLVDTHVLIAHNAKFDRQMLEKEGVKFKLWIDTYRVAMHLVESTCYKLQYLRYALSLDTIQPKAACPDCRHLPEGQVVAGHDHRAIIAHDAAGDVMVLEKLFNFLYERIKERNDSKNIIETMMALSVTPVTFRVFNFGQYLGKSFEEVAGFDRKYLSWLYNKEMAKMQSDQNEDLVHTLKQYLAHG